jgi:ubiquitin
VKQLDKNLILKAINPKENRKQVIEDFEEYEKIYEDTIREAEKLYKAEIAKLSKNFNEQNVLDEEITQFDSTLMLALGAFVFTQAASLAYSKLARAIPDNPELINGLASKFAQERGAVLVEGISKQTQLALRETIGNGIRTGASVSEIAKRVKDNIGLDTRGARAVENLRNNLSTKGISQSKINKQVSDYSAKLLNQRAQLIAQTEVQTAIETAKLEVWKSTGTPTPVQWITDAQPCVKCAPSANDIVLAGQYFQTSMGAYQSPPIHPNCRCQLHPVQSTT